MFSGGIPLNPTVYHQRGVLNGSGAFSISVPSNTGLSPANSYWRITICSQTSSPVETTGGSKKDTCYYVDQVVTGATMNLSTTLSNAAPTPLVNGLLTPFAYSQQEMQQVINGLMPGALYWDLNAGCLKVWNGSSWGCLGGGGGSGTVTSITASSPIIVTPSPIVNTGNISCPTCLTALVTNITAAPPIVVTPSPISAGVGVISCPTCGTTTGTVSSVAQANPSGILSQTGGPITTSGTFVWSWAGTSGGIPCFNSITSMASSALLGLNLPVFGGGAGACPFVGTRSGNTTEVATFSGATTTNNCVKQDASGNLVDSGAPCGTSSGGGANKVPFDSCTAAQAYNQGNSYWRAVDYATGTSVSNSQSGIDLGGWEYATNTDGDVNCKVEIPSNASGTMVVYLDLASADTTNAHTAAFKICYAVSSSQNINNLTYTCTSTQNYSSTTTAYSNTRLSFNTATATVGEYLIANIHQNSGGTNTQPVRMTAKVKVF